MSTYKYIPSFSESPGLRFLAMAAALTAGFWTARADSSSADSKPYTLFMGADFAVALKSQSYPVWDVSGSSWVIKVNGQNVLVSTRGAPVDLKISPGLKLTEVSASIANLKAERSYSAGNDPYEKFARQTNQAASDAFQSQSQSNNAAALSTEASVLGVRYGGANSQAPQGNPNTNGFTQGTGTQRLANMAAQAAAAANVASGASPGVAVGANSAIDLESFDAMDVRFQVTAGRPLEHPYVVLVGRYSEGKGPAGAFRNWISAEALPRIDSRAIQVKILRSGLPKGFEMKDLQVHLFNDGQEVATNLSSKRVELTREDAFEYVKMDYVSSHKGATLPAAPAMGKLPPDLPSRLAGGQFNQPYFVKVSKDGIAAHAYLDAACSRQVEDPYIVGVLKDIRFKPALENGKPVDGIATLKLGQLLM